MAHTHGLDAITPPTDLKNRLWHVISNHAIVRFLTSNHAKIGFVISNHLMANGSIAAVNPIRLNETPPLIGLRPDSTI